MLNSDADFITDMPNFRQTRWRESVTSVNPTKQALVLVAVALAVLGIFSPLVSAQAASLTETSQYQQFVHTNLNSADGNVTEVGKPMFPVYFNDTQIDIGNSWSITEPLVAGHNYHVYCYGAWVNSGSTPKTDYDIYVYNPQGKLESEHTEAAGLPEHLGTRVNDTFFTPQQTGTYTFVVVNDAGQSNGTQQATFMAIENVECNQWQTAYLEGRQPDGTAQDDTAWAYEFVTDQPQIQIFIQVPDTLDIYEARLYLMSDANSLMVNDAPLPWEPGLYGNLSGQVGGYSLDIQAYRGVAYASCEYKGQDMTLTYNATTTGKTLYQLVLIGETGAGNIQFLIKTQQEIPTLTTTKPPTDISPNNATTLTYTSNGTPLQTATLKYTTNNWNTTQQAEMKIQNRTCTAAIPPQTAGTQIHYQITATDLLRNTLQANGSFIVKQLATLNITANHDEIRLGENVTIHGTLTNIKNGTITLQFMSASVTVEQETKIAPNGTFTIQFCPNCTGMWAVQASFEGDQVTFPAFGSQAAFTVEEQPFLVKNGTLIGGVGFCGVVAVSLAYYIKKLRQ
jgi:hypothetical protein